MTTFSTKQVTCGVCGYRDRFSRSCQRALSARPISTAVPPSYSSTMHAWVHECTSCRYCARDLGAASHRVAARVQSQTYLEERAHPDRPALANRFVCAALLGEFDGKLQNAAWDRVAAAWACDDAGLTEEATAQRLAAVQLFERAPARDPNKQLERHAIVVDLRRRAGQLDRASALATEGLTLAAASRASDARGLVGVFTFEIQLCQRGDVACHHLGEVPK